MTAATSEDFSEQLDEAICLSMEHQLNLVNLFGSPRWQYRFPGQITLLGTATVTFDVQILGVAHQEEWRWAWADRQLPPHVTRAARAVRQFGLSADRDLFINPSVTMDHPDTHVLLIAATKAITGLWTTFTFHSRPGWAVVAALENPALQLPPASEITTAQVIGAASEHMRDPRRAITSYARQRSLQLAATPTQVAVGRDTWRVTALLGHRQNVAELTVETNA